MFLGFRFFELLHIYRFCFSVDAFDFGIRLDVRFTHLQRNAEKAFKQETGGTPSKYRKENRKTTKERLLRVQKELEEYGDKKTKYL